jgi:hypothetical protein
MLHIFLKIINSKFSKNIIFLEKLIIIIIYLFFIITGFYILFYIFPKIFVSEKINCVGISSKKIIIENIWFNLFNGIFEEKAELILNSLHLSNINNLDISFNLIKPKNNFKWDYLSNLNHNQLK